MRIPTTAATKKSATTALLLTRPHIKKPGNDTNQYHPFYSYQIINHDNKHLYFEINQKQNHLHNDMVNISPAADTIAHHSSSISSNRVLLVDDEPDIARLFKLGLELNGIVVDTFNDPIVALSNYKAGVYNLLLLDLKMPKMNGFELYKKIKDKEDRNNRGVKVCFITAFEEYYREFQESFPNLDIDCFIRKPISIDELVKVVKTKLNS